MVHISPDTKALLPEDRYHLEPRGVVWVKVSREVIIIIYIPPIPSSYLSLY